MNAESRKVQLESWLLEHAKEDICLAFSGGVDSSLILKVAADAVRKTNRQVHAVTFDSRLHPACDLEIARTVAGELGGIHKVITVDELEQKDIRMNPVNRCYLCKHHLFNTLREYAHSQGITTILDGTNEDDLHVYRPGIAALKELGILSPLAELHMTKQEVKELAVLYGISVSSRPSTPCMATRLPYNTELDYDVLRRIGEGEAYLKTLISGNVRLRLHGDIARIEIDKENFKDFLKEYENAVDFMKKLGFSYVTLDLEGFRSGSMDIYITDK